MKQTKILDNTHHFNFKPWTHKLLALAGFHAFLFTLPVKHPLIVCTCLVMTGVLYFKFVQKKNYMDLLFPLALGLLIFPMKLFYWDKVDYLSRVSNLLILALLLSMGLIIKRFHLHRKFLLFFNSLSLKKRGIGIFIVAELLFILAAFIIIQKGVILGGDEPHYLVISQSIAKDGDINVFNQYARNLYREFIAVELDHHARIGKGFKVWYSYGHLPGLSLTLAPFFLCKLPMPILYFVVRAFLGLFAAFLAVLIFLFALRLWQNRSLALFITVTYTLTAPVFFYGIHIFAELQASLLILSALYLVLYAETGKQTHARFLWAGFLLGISVFWGLKYAIFIFLLAAGFFVYWMIKKQPKRAILFVLFPVLLQILFFGFLYYGYGNFQPMSIYNGVMTPQQEKTYQSNMEQIPLQKRAETLLGIFFDQRDGLILYNPFYLLFFPGLLLAIKKYRTYWPHLLISSVGFAFIFFVGYSTVRAGYCPQARYVVPSAWALMLFAIIYYQETSNKLFRKLSLYLPIVGMLMVLYQVFHPFTLYQSVTHMDLERAGLMFQQWSNLYCYLPNWLPSFVKVPGNFAYLPNIIFLTGVVLFTFLALKKMKNYRLKYAPHLFFSLLFGMFVLFPTVPYYNPILLSKDDNPRCNIYGESTYPTDTTERKFELIGKDRYTFTLSTSKPVPTFRVVFENYSTGAYQVRIFNFDRRVTGLKIPAGTIQQVEIPNAMYKVFKNNTFYRFHFEVSPTPGSKPELFLQIYPLK